MRLEKVVIFQGLMGAADLTLTLKEEVAAC